MPLERQLIDCKRAYWRAWIRDNQAEMGVAQGRAASVRAQGAAEPTDEQDKQILHDALVDVKDLWWDAKLAGNTAEMDRLEAKANELRDRGAVVTDSESKEIERRHTAAQDGGIDLDRVLRAVSRNEGTYDTSAVLADDAGLSFGILQWTARYTLRQLIIQPVLYTSWFQNALGGLYPELVSMMDSSTEEFVEWSKRDAVLSAFRNAGRTPEMKAHEDLVGQRFVQQCIVDLQNDSGGLLTGERALAWYADTRNQCGSGEWDAVRQAIAYAETTLGRGLCQSERILLASKCQAKFLAAAKWESDVFGREAAYAIDVVPGNPRSDYTDLGLGWGPDTYAGVDTLRLELDPTLNFGGNNGLTDRPHPGLRTVFRWNPTAQAYRLVEADQIEPHGQALDPTRDIRFNPPVSTSSQHWSTWPGQTE